MTMIEKGTDGQRRPPQWRRVANWALALGLGWAGASSTGCATDDGYAGPLPVLRQPDGVPVHGSTGTGFGAGQVAGDGRYREAGVSEYTAAATQLAAGQPTAGAGAAPSPVPSAEGAGPTTAPAPAPPPTPVGDGGVPTANWADASAGLVHSPHGTPDQLVDVVGMEAGSTVKCPYTGKLFRVPAAPGS